MYMTHMAQDDYDLSCTHDSHTIFYFVILISVLCVFFDFIMFCSNVETTVFWIFMISVWGPINVL